MLTTVPSEEQLARVFLQRGQLSQADLKQVMDAAGTTGQRMRVVLDRLGFVPQTDWAQTTAQELGLPLITFEQMPETLPQDPRLSADYLRRNAIAPLDISDTRARLAVADPFDRDAMGALEMIFGTALDLVVATDRDIELAIERSAKGGEVEAVSAGGALDADKLAELANNAPTIRYLQSLFAAAVELRATDIHIEALPDKPRVRLRIDGELAEVRPPDPTMYEGIVSRLKILAGMDISERRLPQDGRIRQKAAGRDIDMRVASAPTIHGETMVLRLLDNQEDLSRLEHLKLPQTIGTKLRAAIDEPNGLVLVTGPTGSGKTTTLHSAMNEINDTRRKIITIENPVEIQTKGLQQIEVNPDLGWTFAAALRTVLRHDPDVIMVGEIRDQETAELAVRAAMTGHLVFSTLHTNSASEAATRMVDLGVPDYLVSSVVRLVAAQRLVRKVCPDCAKPVDLSADPQKQAMFERLADRDPELGSAHDWTAVQKAGCEACNWTGYKGRLAVFEALDAGEIADAMAGQPSAARTMGHEGMRLVANGQTTFEEVTRVLGTAGLVM
ncbi:GspE/PulE family protein [Litoreibacter roseus]|uniref:Type II secretion system protein E n=1 Tax=Litoreibacter roseus TaxID=2601869 RepID=A0A6N6JM68_9RHOB|nr:GspE/PulE family protein [Litoreibacter roseus]GFE66489.1 type II secretion system protein E [Litoreibacter roseus]